MIIDCVSDLHGNIPVLTGGDLLIIAGDLTATDTVEEYFKIFGWIANQKYRKKILIAGNHDNVLKDEKWLAQKCVDFDYLCDSVTDFEGVKIWGSPWTNWFKGINPRCKAFTYSKESAMKNKFDLIPGDVDILVTHSPAFGILDYRELEDGTRYHMGSISLQNRLKDIKPKLHVFGHIHECGCMVEDTEYTRHINVSVVDEHYKIRNNFMRTEWT